MNFVRLDEDQVIAFEMNKSKKQTQLFIWTKYTLT